MADLTEVNSLFPFLIVLFTDQNWSTAMFSPLAFPTGLILYDLSTASPPLSHTALSPFELYREPLLVIGVADGSQNGSSPGGVSRNSDEEVDDVKVRECRESLYQYLQHEREKTIEAYPRSLVHRILLFDHILPATNLPDGLMAIPSLKSSNTTTIKTVMCDLTSQLLADMTGFAKSLQALTSVDTPRVNQGGIGVDGGFDSTSYGTGVSRPTSANHDTRSRSPARNGVNSQNRMSMPVHMPSTSSSRAATPDGRPLSPPGRSQTPPTTFDEIAGSRLTSSPSKSGVNNSRQQSRDRVSVQGFGAGGSGEKERVKGRSRVGTIIGAMYLLAGRWPDALKELVESANIARANSDYAWLAKALDYIVVTLLMYAWAGMDFKVSLGTNCLLLFEIRLLIVSKIQKLKASRSLKSYTLALIGQAKFPILNPQKVCLMSQLPTLELQADLSHCRT